MTACAPTPAKVVLSPAGIVNTNTDVPCSVTGAAFGAIVAALVEPATLPTATDAIVFGTAIVPGEPKPVTIAVTTVPTGPEVGDNVTVVAPSESVVVALLLKASLRVNTGPSTVTAGKLTVALPFTALLLKVVGVAVVDPEETAIVFPENDAAAITLVYHGENPPGADGNAELVTITEVPAATVDGATATVGVVIVKVPAMTLVVASEMITVCEPTARP